VPENYGAYWQRMANRVDRYLRRGRTVAGTLVTIDDYISTFPEDVQVILEQIRRTIRHAAPAVEETISYQMPTLTLDGKDLVHFAAWKHHISLYPVPAGDETFAREIAPYKAAKGTVRFPLRQPIPYDLIARLVAFRAQERLDSDERR
jgi:uncharacterized protein YdhG (YjbR/CyaY superfamily)